MIASTLSFLRTKILGKYKGMQPFFSLSQWHLGFFAYFESGIALINQLATVRNSHKAAKKVLKFNFNAPRYTLDQLLQVTEKVKTSSLYLILLICSTVSFLFHCIKVQIIGEPCLISKVF